VKAVWNVPGQASPAERIGGGGSSRGAELAQVAGGGRKGEGGQSAQAVGGGCWARECRVFTKGQQVKNPAGNPTRLYAAAAAEINLRAGERGNRANIRMRTSHPLIQIHKLRRLN